MKTFVRRWAEMKTTDFADMDVSATVAVMPVAATEQHGPHLPLGVDTLLVDGIVGSALGVLPADCPVLVLPTQTIGLSPEHAAFAGTLSLSPATVLSVWLEMGACVAKAGVRKLLIFNAHGGHAGIMDVVARELRVRHGLIVYSSSWYQLPLGEEVMGLFPAQEHRFGVHAGDMETSLMLALRPDLVDMTQARNFESTSQLRAARYSLLGDGRSAKLGWMMQDYNLQGAAGNASAATAEKGQALLSAAGQQLARLLQEISSLPLNMLQAGPLGGTPGQA